MAQHILINNSEFKGFQKIYNCICKNFENGLFYARSSLKYEEIKDERYKDSSEESVFVTYRSINGQREIFEVHFDTNENQVTQVYLVK